MHIARRKPAAVSAPYPPSILPDMATETCVELLQSGWAWLLQAFFFARPNVQACCVFLGGCRQPVIRVTWSRGALVVHINLKATMTGVCSYGPLLPRAASI